jgi:hypothetical protein
MEKQVHNRVERWQRFEHIMTPLILAILGMICSTYLRKIEALVIGSEWIMTSASVGMSILAVVWWWRKRIMERASVWTVKIKNVTFRIRQDRLPALYPLLFDLACSGDVSHEDVRDALMWISEPMMLRH